MAGVHERKSGLTTFVFILEETENKFSRGEGK